MPAGKVKRCKKRGKGQKEQRGPGQLIEGESERAKRWESGWQQKVWVGERWGTGPSPSKSLVRGKGGRARRPGGVQ